MLMKQIITFCCVVTISLFFSCREENKEVVPDVIQTEAQPFPLSDLRLLEGSPFKHAMDKDAEWLMQLDADRLLYRFRLNAGLPVIGEPYGGWEGLGVSGHTLGHYLSACSMMYAASGDQRFKARVDYIVKVLAECQEARQTGYVGAIPNEDKLWDDVSKGNITYDGFNLNGYWVPWYTQHKIWAGLIDSYLYADNSQAKEVAVKLSDWAVNLLKDLTPEQFQGMLASEFGGMNESLAQMYAITGNEAYLQLAEKFYHKAIFDPLNEQRDDLEGKHANTQIPKVIGAARLYELTGKENYHTIATYFWGQIVDHRCYLNGGNSNHEHLGKPDLLSKELSAFTSETCNTYNMLKLTRHLFSWDARASYFDFYERALYNHILASQNPEDGMVCYCVPLESGKEKTFSTPFDAFWCCVGTGIENHVKYAESIFFRSADDGLFVNLFIPVELNWKEKGLKVRLQTKLPESNQVRITFEGKKQSFPLHLRCPKWAKQGMKISINGQEQPVSTDPGSYLTLNGDWGTGTELLIEMPLELYTESMPDNPKRIGVFYGPVLLAAPLGKEEVQVYDIPVFISDSLDVVKGIQPAANVANSGQEGGNSLVFSTGTFSSPANIRLQPFYQVYGQKYAVYFDIFTPAEWKVKEKEYQQIIDAQKKLEAQTVDILRIGEMQPERDHELQSENSSAGDANGLKFRHAFNGWFSFNVKVLPDRPVQMMCSFWGADKDKRDFNILIDGKHFKKVSLQGTHGPALFDEVYDIPMEFTQGKEKINVKFQSEPDNHAGGLFGFRILKK